MYAANCPNVCFRCTSADGKFMKNILFLLVFAVFPSIPSNYAFRLVHFKIMLTTHL